MNAIIESKGGNNYAIPCIGKIKMACNGGLPKVLHVTPVAKEIEEACYTNFVHIAAGFLENDSL